jgi:site-specific DNA recombinase
VDRLLRDPTAKGERRSNYTKSLGNKKHWKFKPQEDWVLTSVEAIVSEDIWVQCNAILDGRRETGKRITKKAVHLFAGVTFCTCGEKMYVPSNSPSLLIEKADLLRTLERDRQKAKAEMDQTYRLYIDGNLSSEGFGIRNGPLEARLKQLDDQIPKLNGEIDFLKIQYLSSGQIVSEAKDLYSRWPHLEPAEKRSLIEAITDKIVIGKDEVAIDLSYVPPIPQIVAKEQRNFKDSPVPGRDNAKA